MEVENLCRAGDKKMKSGVMSMFTGGADYEGASDLYVQAANLCKINKDWRKAADCYMKAACAQEKQSDISRQATFLQEAGNALKRISAEEAAVKFTEAASLFNAAGRFAQSAKMLKGVAEAFEVDGDHVQAMKNYKKAAEYFDMDEYGKSSYSACMLKYADYVAKLDRDYKEAIKIYEAEGEKALRNSTLQFGAKEHYLKAGILRLVIGDSVDMKIALERYEELDSRLASSREGKLLRTCIIAYTEQDEESFTNAVKEFDSISRLDPWKVHFLFQAKETLHKMGAKGKAPAVDLQEDEEGELDLS